MRNGGRFGSIGTNVGEEVKMKMGRWVDIFCDEDVIR